MIGDAPRLRALLADASPGACFDEAKTEAENVVALTTRDLAMLRRAVAAS